MNGKFTSIFVMVAMIALIAIGMLGAVAQAAPPAAPTPVANVLQSDDVEFFRFQPEAAIAADTYTGGVDVMQFDALDVQATVDQGAVTNTLSISVQYSNDNTNWDDGLTLVSSSSADVTEMTRVPVFGRYMRLKQDVANTNTVTVTLLAVGR